MKVKITDYKSATSDIGLGFEYVTEFNKVYK